MQKVIVADGTELDLVSKSIATTDGSVDSVTLLIAIREDDNETTKESLIAKLESGISKITDENGDAIYDSGIVYVSSVPQIEELAEGTEQEPVVLEIPTIFTLVSNANVNDGRFCIGKDGEGNDLYAKQTVAITMLSETKADGYLATLKENVIAKMSAICNQKIEQGLTLTLSDGSEKTFSYNAVDRENIKQMFDAIVMGATAYPYHENDGNCQTFSAEDIIIIYTSMVKNKTHHTTYFNQLKQYIKNAKKVSVVSDVVYGQELKNQYLETYNAMMAEAETQLNNILAKIGA